MVNDWYRKTTWTAADEKDFAKRYESAKSGKAQYLFVQALSLFEQKNEELNKIALKLLKKYFKDFPNDKNERTGALHLAAQIYEGRKKSKKAFEYYKKAAEHEAEFPKLLIGAWLDYAVFIIKHKKKKLYSEAENYIYNQYDKMVFADHIYKANAVLAAIWKKKRDRKTHRYYKERADSAAKESGNQKIGSVIRDKRLDKMMK